VETKMLPDLVRTNSALGLHDRRLNLKLYKHRRRQLKNKVSNLKRVQQASTSRRVQQESTSRRLEARKRGMRRSVGNANLLDAYTSAKPSEAEEFRIRNMMHKTGEDGDPELYDLCDTDVMDLPLEGGVHAYLETLWYMAMIFMLLSLLMLPTMMLYSHGDQLEGFMAQLTLGNLGPIDRQGKNSTDTKIAGMRREDLGMFVSWMDLLSCLVFAGFLYWFSHKLKQQHIETRDFVDVQTFSVRVILPHGCQDATRKELREFFEYYGRVVDVAVLWNRTQLIQLHVEKNHLKQEKKLAEERHKQHVDRYTEAIEELDKHIAEEEKRTRFARVAMITFDELRDKKKCLKSHVHLTRCCCYFGRKFKGHSILVEEAPEPTDVTYEALDYELYQVYLHRLVSLLFWVILIVCVMSMYTVVMEYEASLPDEQDCTTFYDQAYIKSNNATQEEVYCYCYQLSYQDLLSERSTCNDYIQERAKLTLITYSLSMVTGFAVVVLELLIPILAKYDLHSSHSLTETVIMNRLFVGEFVIEGALVTLASFDLNSMFGVNFWFSGADYTKFDSDWFQTIGTAIVFNSLFVTLFEGALILGGEMTACVNRCCARRRADQLTQSELNHQYLGIEMTMGDKYANILSEIFLSFTFSSGIPVLFVATSCLFVVLYVCERFAILRSYAHPHMYDMHISDNFLAMATVSLAFHAGIAFVNFGSSDFFDYYYIVEQEQASAAAGIPLLTVFDGLYNWSGLPHFIFLVCILVFIIVRYLVNKFTQKCIRVLKCLGCSTLSERLAGRGYPEHMEKITFFEQLRISEHAFETYHPCNRVEYHDAFKRYPNAASGDGDGGEEGELDPCLPLYLDDRYWREFPFKDCIEYQTHFDRFCDSNNVEHLEERWRNRYNDVAGGKGGEGGGGGYHKEVVHTDNGEGQRTVTTHSAVSPSGGRVDTSSMDTQRLISPTRQGGGGGLEPLREEDEWTKEKRHSERPDGSTASTAVKMPKSTKTTDADSPSMHLSL